MASAERGTRQPGTLVEWAEAWNEGRDVQPARRHADWTRMQKYVLPQWGRTRLDRITTTAIQRWVDEPRWKAVVKTTHTWLTPGPATKYASLMALRQVLDHAVQAGALTSNPAEGVSVGEPTSIVRLQDDEDVLLPGDGERLVQAADPHYRPLFLLALRLGTTWAEATGLQESDIDLKRNRITIGRLLGVEAEGRVTTEVGDVRRLRVLEMPRDLVAEFQRFLPATADLRHSLDLPWVFVTPNGKRILRPNFNRYVLRPALVRAGLDERAATFHTLRHTAARDMLQAGADLEHVAHALGHLTVNTTRRMYGGFVPA